MPSLIRFATNYGARLALIWLAVTAANLLKPYHVDDDVHLEIARWIAAHPMHPMSGTIPYGGIDTPIHSLNQPPLYFYLLAIWGSLFGYGEATMHALQSLFTLAATLLFYRIARRLAPANALWLTAMLMLGPSVAVEQNLMVDVPLLSLWLLFFDALILGTDADSKAQDRRFLVAALACSAAILVKYSSLALVPVLLVTIAYERRWRVLWAAVIPVAVLAAWSLFNYLDYGGIHIAERPAHIFKYSTYAFFLPMLRLTSIMVTLGAITPFGLIAAVRLVPALRLWAPAIYTAAASLALLLVTGVATGRLDETVADQTSRALFLLNAAAMAIAVTIALVGRPAGWRAYLEPNPANARILILFLWIAGHVGFYSLYAPFMAVRHVLLVLPAVLLAGAMPWPARLPRADATFGLAATIGLSIMLGWADWRFAAFFRDEPAAIRARLPAGAHIWFAGGMGWRWYATRAGLLSEDDERTNLARGDFVVVPRDQGPLAMPNPPRLVLVGHDDKPLSIGDLFCTADLTRFYTTPFTHPTEAPWLLTRACTNTIDIYQAE
jgi:4-amino-4-deoxy-L-arabinose transferase-like glycosyltransferase